MMCMVFWARLAPRPSHRRAMTDPHQTAQYVQDKPGSTRDFPAQGSPVCLRGRKLKA